MIITVILIFIFEIIKIKILEKVLQSIKIYFK